jgi:1,2-diacylglycerol-3-alpha-glucose alpha-1,2-glucosyltransferase
LASRCPLVVRDIGVYEGWVKDGYDGHLCKNNDEFAAVIQELLDYGEKKEILDNGYQVAAERDLSKIGDQLKAAYEKLLLEKKGN